MAKITYIDEVELKNKKVLMRADFNVSLDKSGNIKSDARIKQTLPTIKHLLANKNQLIIMSHLGKPKGRDLQFSLKPVADRLQEYFPEYHVVLVDDFLKDSETIGKINDKTIILLENIRFYPEEKKNDPEFSKKLTQMAEVFVNDGFAVCHRPDASVVGVAKLLPSYGGLLLKKEVEMISRTIHNPVSPVVAIIAGAKISTKIGLIEKLLQIADQVLIGGAMANTFWTAMGRGIGKSLTEPDFVAEADRLLKIAKTSSHSLVIPTDAVVGLMDNEEKPGIVKNSLDIEADDVILDIGPTTGKQFQELISKAKTIIWNGPVGYFENPQYAKGTDMIYEAVVSNTNAISVVGGGDTLTAIKNKKQNSKITHISTGGGAMLELIEKGTLPGIEALSK